MVRLNDLPAGERDLMMKIPMPHFDSTPFVTGKPLSERRIAILSTAALQTRSDRVFAWGDAGYRVIPGQTQPNDIIMSHRSVNFDRSGFQQDYNVCFPLDRLRELADAGVIGSVADYHYTVMGANPPERLEDTARHIAGLMKRDAVDTALLIPV